ncbi:MAG: extracellular solute-binding protein, partial [Alsobacter sp.]
MSRQRIMTPIHFLFAALLCAWATLVQVPGPAAAEPRHGIAMHGEPALRPDFQAMPYVRADAPKGGRIVFGVQGTFDTLNPFAVRGIAAQGIAPPTALVIQGLMARNFDEPFSLYGLVAESIETPPDRSWVVFRLNPKARFSDNKPVTAADVLFTFELLKTRGKPSYRSWFGKVRSATAPDAMTVRFDLASGEDRELPLILALMPVLARHAVNPETFEQTSFAPILGTGPYVVGEVKPGESITYRRNPDYWGADLPITRGLANADEVRFDYYRDANGLFEAFKGGLYDVRSEDSPTRWTTGYDFPAVRDGRVMRDPIPLRTPKGMNAFVFNTRRPVFADVRVREALGLLFDFDWVNRNLFGSVYRRTTSFFEGSDLAASGLPASAGERTLLARFPAAVRDDILEGRWSPARGDGSGRDRDLARQALALLGTAGWEMRDGVLRNRASGEPLAFEFLAASRVQERLALNYAQSLKRLGIAMTVRIVDDVQYWRRLSGFE